MLQGGFSMNGIGSWFRQLGYKMRTGLQHFMMGRYGQMDKLNSLLLWTGVIIVLVSMFFPAGVVTLILPLVSYGLLGVSLWRMLSRNVYKRARENRRYISFLERLKDREHRYYSCPACKQDVRVPKGKGKISITCPKCREKFIRKT